MRVYVAGGNPSAIARFNPSNGGSGYAFVLYTGNQIYLYKAVNGSLQANITGATLSGIPSNPIMEFIVQDIDSSDTQLTVNFYNQSDPNTIVATYSYTDSSSPIQSPGYWGAGEYSDMYTSRIQTYVYVPGGPITPGAVSVNFGSIYKTQASLTSALASGGVGPFTYQWQRSLASTTGFTNIPNATTTSYTDTGLTPGTTYFYRMDITDSTTPTPQEATSTTLQVTTVASNGHVIGYIGDSITTGFGSNNGTTLSDGPGAVIEYLTLQNDGYSVGYNNQGYPGTSASDWQPGGGYLPGVLTSFENTGVDTVSIMIGTNDASETFTSPSTYQTNLQNLVNALLASGTGITRVILNYSPYLNAPGNGQATTTPTLAQANALIVQYESAINSIASSTPGVYLGDTTLYAASKNNADTINNWGFGPHPYEAGHQYMGAAWYDAYVADFSHPYSVTATSTSNGATISWNTDVDASTILNYGTSTSYTASTTETDISPRVTNHTVVLSNLNACTTYHYQPLSKNTSGAQQTGSDATFTTTGCAPSSSTPTSTGVGIPSSSGSYGISPFTPTLLPTPSPLACIAGALFNTHTGAPCPSLSVLPSTLPIPTQSSTTPSISPSFTLNLHYKMTNSQVKTLQQYLNAHGFTVATTGAGSAGKETDYFGAATKAALIKFQKVHGITPSVGYFGTITRKAISTQ